jgi:ubiquinone/menaquinone biosynthesis C-methylase UbiE
LTDEEIKTLQIQDQLATVALGGVLPEQPNLHAFKHMLDIGCGTGNWLLEAAQTYPTATHLTGIDASARLIASAQAQAQAHHMSDRVQFRQMNALGFLDFPKASFDLVNLRFGASFLRTWEWNDLLQNCKRILRSGGVMRITESDLVESSSALVSRREDLVLQAFYQAGHYFAPQKDGLTRELAPLLHQAGFHTIQTRVHTLSYQNGHVERQLASKYLDQGFEALRPFLEKWIKIPKNQEEDSRHLRDEMQQPDFTARVHVHTVWGNTA